MIILEPDQRAYLIKVAKSSDTILSIEERINIARKRFRRLAALCTFGLFVIGIGASSIAVRFIVARADYSTQAVLLTLLGFYTIGFLTVWISVHSSPEYATFATLIDCISEVDNVIGSAPAARSRKNLARKLLACVRKMRSYRPIVPLRLHKRIMSQEATRASHALRQLVHPVMLGNDEEIRKVKETLARAAIWVGTANWVQVGDLGDSSVSKPVRVRAVLGSLVPFFAGVVVPLTAALITALVK